MLTIQEMHNAFFAHEVDLTARTEECSPEAWMRSISIDEEGRDVVVMLAQYQDGKRVLADWRPVIHRDRVTIFPDANENQIVVDAGYIATSPAWRLVSFVPR
jgi:hypothetical protein